MLDLDFALAQVHAVVPRQFLLSECLHYLLHSRVQVALNVTDIVLERHA